MHRFDQPPEQVAAALLDLDFQATLDGIGRLAEREVLSQEERADGVIVRRCRCVLDIDIGGPAQSLIGDGDPAWIEIAEWNASRLTWTWVIEPEVAADLLASHGRMMLRPDGEGTERVVDLDVKVRVPFYGGKLEAKIVEELAETYDEEATRLAKWLAERA